MYKRIRLIFWPVGPRLWYCDCKGIGSQRLVFSDRGSDIFSDNGYLLLKFRVGVNLLPRPSQDSVCISVVLPTRSDCITITSSEISHHSTDLSTNLTTFEVGNGFDHRNGSHLFSTRTNPAILSAAASSRSQAIAYWQNWAKASGQRAGLRNPQGKNTPNQNNLARISRM